MTQEEKQKLLLKDLCARLPYEVIVHLVYDENTIVDREMGLGSLHDIMFDNAEGIPYLRPMESMTDEERIEYRQKQTNYEFGYFDTYVSIDWLNKKMFDYRHLIPMGLALPATEGIYNIQ
jgi:hypothetical protein